MTEQYQQVDINHGSEESGGGGGSFVYRPGGPSTGNVYADFSQAYAAARSASPGSVLEIDSSIVAPAPIPAGVFDFDGIVLKGNLQNLIGNGTGTTAELSDGCVFENLVDVDDALTMNSLSSSPVITIPSGFQRILLLGRGCAIGSTSGTPFVRVPDAGQLSMILSLGGRLNTDAISVEDNGGADIICLDYAAVSSDAVAGTALAFVNLQLTGQGLDVELPMTNFAGQVDGSFSRAGGSDIFFSSSVLSATGATYLSTGGSSAAASSPTPLRFVATRNMFIGAVSVRHNTPAGSPNSVTYEIEVDGTVVKTLSTDAQNTSAFDGNGGWVAVNNGSEIAVRANSTTNDFPGGIVFCFQAV